MAQKILTSYIDDIDGSEAESTIRFGFDGADFEIDLSAENGAALRAVLAPYIDAARRSTGAASTARRASAKVGSRASNRADNGAVRAWLRWQEYDVKDRGRIPPSLLALVPPNVAEIVGGWPNGEPPAKPAENVILDSPPAGEKSSTTITILDSEPASTTRPARARKATTAKSTTKPASAAKEPATAK